MNEDITRFANILGGLGLAGSAAKALPSDEAEQKIDREIDAAEQRISVLRELKKRTWTVTASRSKPSCARRRLPPVRDAGPEPGHSARRQRLWRRHRNRARRVAAQNIVVEDSGAAKAAIAF